MPKKFKLTHSERKELVKFRNKSFNQDFFERIKEVLKDEDKDIPALAKYLEVNEDLLTKLIRKYCGIDTSLDKICIERLINIEYYLLKHHTKIQSRLNKELDFRRVCNYCKKLYQPKGNERLCKYCIVKEEKRKRGKDIGWKYKKV